MPGAADADLFASVGAVLGTLCGDKGVIGNFTLAALCEAEFNQIDQFQRVYIAVEQTFAEHTWWSPEDYQANNFKMLTSDEVYRHFCKTLNAYNELERNNNLIETKLLTESHEFTAEKLNRDSICRVVRQWNKKLADLELDITETDIEPLIRDLKFNERRQLIIEKPKGFFEFITYSYPDQIYQYIRFTYVPKLKACAERLSRLYIKRKREI